MNKIISLSFLCLLFLFSSCRKDEKTTGNGAGPNPPGIDVEASVYGVILNAGTDIPIENVNVELNGEQLSTDENGFFRLNDGFFDKDGALIKASKSGYYDAFNFLIPKPGEDHFVKMYLIIKRPKGTFNTSSSALVEIGDDGPTLAFKPNSLATEDGQMYEGDYTVNAHWFNPTSADFVATMPGDLRGENTNGESVQLESYGMIAVEIEGANGEDLNLLAGETAEWVLPLDPNLTDIPSEIPIWSLNEDTGIWLEEGKANLVDGKYVSQLSHFSFWNCDAPYPLVEIEGRLLDQNGTAITNELIEIRIEGGGTSGRGSSDDDGYFAGKVPKDQSLILSIVSSCDSLSNYDVPLGSLSEDTNLGDVVIVVHDDAYVSYSGIFLDCSGVPVSNGYIKLMAGNKLLDLVQVEANGSFANTIQFCEAQTISIQGVDESGLTESEVQEVFMEPDGNYPLGDISACEDLDQYFIFTQDGIPYATTNVELRMSGALLELTAEDVFFEADPSSKNRIQIDLSTNSLSSFYCFVGDEATAVWCVDNFGAPCEENLNMELSEVPTQQGEYLMGSITGQLQDDEQGNTYDIDISFRVKLTIIQVTISGKFWLDENENGIFDAQETTISNAGQIVISSNQPDFPVSLTPEEDGSFYTDEIFPGSDYAINVNLLAGYELTLQDQGMDDNLDSDFNPDGSPFTIEAISESIFNLDVGLVVSNEVNCNIEVLPKYCDEGSGCIIVNLVNNLETPFEVTTNNIHYAPQTGYFEICDFEEGSYNVLVEVPSTGQSCEQIIEITQEDIVITTEKFELLCVDGNVVANIEVLINGGVYPFGPLWYDESNNVQQSGPYFNNVSPGEYRFDASYKDCISSESFYVPEQYYIIKGKVWDDNEGSIANVGESNEAGIQNIELSLYDNDANLISSTMSDEDGLYTFELTTENLSGFFLAIETDSYELVDQGADTTGDEISSAADPISEVTNTIEIAQNCETFEINFGLK